MQTNTIKTNEEVHTKLIGKTEYIVTSIYSGKEDISKKIVNLIQRKAEKK